MRLFGTLAVGCLTIAMVPTAALAVAPAMWDLYPKLICSYQEAQFCQTDLSGCTNDSGKAVLEFDFRKNQIRSFAAGHTTPITARYHIDLDGDPSSANNALMSKYGYAGDFDTNAVFSNGTLYSFVKARKSDIPSGADTIDGIVQSAMNNDILTVHMTCHPE
jgi:hypothetical protein